MFGFLPSPKTCGVPGAAALYRSHFCGLCNVLRNDYGLWARGIINRDSTFLALLGAAQCEAQPQTRCATCCNPFGVSRPLHQVGDTTQYAAAVTLCGLSSKLDDDIDDERGPRRWLARGASFCLDGSVSKAMGFLHAVAFPVARVHHLLSSQSAVEHPTASLEDAAEPTSQAFGEIVAHTGIVAGCQPSQRPFLRIIGEQLGFLIYVKDAWDDFDSDEKRGRFNALRSHSTEGERRARILPLLQAAIAKIEEAFSQLELHRYRDTLHSILVDGVNQRLASWMGLPAPSVPNPPLVTPPQPTGSSRRAEANEPDEKKETCGKRCNKRCTDCRDDCDNKRGARKSRCCDHCDCCDCGDCCRVLDCSDCKHCDGCDCPGCDCCDCSCH